MAAAAKKATPTPDAPADPPAADEPAEHAPATDAPAEEPSPDRPRPWVSEGMRQDVEQHGFAIDPNTGRRVTADDLR